MSRVRSAEVGLVGVVAIVAAANCDAMARSDEEARRAELVARLERSVVVVFSEGQEISHQKSLVTLLPSEGLGTGVVISPDGLVLTAAHVVAGSERVRVKLSGGEPLPARIVLEDDSADVALLRLESVPPALAPARLGDSDRARKGETVYVIGNPVGIEFSLSTGVVSGRHPTRHVFGGSVEAEVIQTDAAINSGNSGGPIFNSRGEVIAIAQSILSKGGGFEGLGFGLSINTVKKVLGLDPCLWLGLSGVSLDDISAELLNVPAQSGLLVQTVTPGGPAEKAGVRGGVVPIQVGSEHILLGGDVILQVDGVSAVDWMRKPPPTGGRPGDRHELKLSLLRAGRVLEVSISAIHRPSW